VFSLRAETQCVSVNQRPHHLRRHQTGVPGAVSRDPLARALSNAARNVPYACPDLGQELSPFDPAPETISEKAREMEALDEAGLPEPGEYFVKRGEPLPEWFWRMARHPHPKWTGPTSFDRIISVQPDGTVSVRRSLGAAEHR
jgi:hypothetical protein